MSFNLTDYDVLSNNTVQPIQRTEPLNISLPKLPKKNKSKIEEKLECICKPQIVNGVTTFSSIFTFVLVISLCISCIVIYVDVSKLMEDGKDTLNDLSIVLPEVSSTMKMLQNLCNTPEFKHYCFPE